LEIGGGFKMGESSNIHMGGAELLFEFSTKVFPVNKSVRFRGFFLSMEYSGSPFLNSSHFYVALIILVWSLEKLSRHRWM
jgi:hypothetical protein